MSRRTASLTAWTLLAVTVAGIVCMVWLDARVPRSPAAPRSLPLLEWATTSSLPIVVAVAIGALIASRRPGNRVGWILIAASLVFVVTELGASYALYGHTTPSRPPPGAVWAAWVGSWLWSVSFPLFFVLLPLVFPDGRLPSRRWRPVVWATAAGTVLQACALALMPGPLSPSDRTALTWENPIGLAGARDVLTLAIDLVAAAFLGFLIAAVAALVVRYRGTGGRERHQVKWLLLAVTAVALFFPLNTLPLVGPVLQPLGGLVISLIPAAIGVAVLRYRLYEIDKLISRTVTYALVTAALVVVYALVAVLPSTVLAFESDLLVAAATLVVAAAFVPMRRRVQAMVDHRFNRSSYDATHVVERFGVRLRDQVSLDTLCADMVAVVDATVQPHHRSVWLRAVEPQPGDARR